MIVYGQACGTERGEELILSCKMFDGPRSFMGKLVNQKTRSATKIYNVSCFAGIPAKPQYIFITFCCLENKKA